MASSFRIEINESEVRALLNSSEVAGELFAIGQAVASRAGEGYEVDQFRGWDRAYVYVKPVSDAAQRAEASTHRLLNSIPAGGGR